MSVVITEAQAGRQHVLGGDWSVRALTDTERALRDGVLKWDFHRQRVVDDDNKIVVWVPEEIGARLASRHNKLVPQSVLSFKGTLHLIAETVESLTPCAHRLCSRCAGKRSKRVERLGRGNYETR